MPIIVGAPRSGTTLLRLMLDAHPDLAIPPETGFLSLADAWLTDPPSADRWLDEVIGFSPDAPVWPDFQDALLAHHRSARERLREHGPRLSADGSILVTRDVRQRQQQLTAAPVTAQRIGRWRRDWAEGDIEQFERVAGPLLSALGYERGAR